MRENRDVGIVVEHDLVDRALLETVRRFGYDAVYYDFELPVQRDPLPAVLVVRRPERLSRVQALAASGRARVIAVESEGTSFLSARNLSVVPAADDAAKHLKAALEYWLGAPRNRGAIAMSPRERAVLATYVLGATVNETAEQHFVATSTVRTHYRRVAGRYNEAGRPAGNKAQLLLQMVADGWIRLPDGFAEARRQGAGAA
ncbi:MAG: LuxR C-terminal-related transcriptional regulator [Gordonia sp. (in: high G+C Gram-positive bacteria)]|uniref:helix-turn-helix transcriptional regulator n=1 Tax=Gordonia sp. (in: high G+C Gram-positive bacteria) TaxID=84139 RepID=UPI0039E7289C